MKTTARADRRPLLLIAAVLLLSLLLLAACADGGPAAETEETAAPDGIAAPAETPERQPLVFEKKYGSGLLMEPMSGRMLFSGEYASADVDGRRYDFERTIPEEERRELVWAEEELLRLLACAEPLTVRTLADYPCFSDSAARTVYLGADASRSWRQILATLSALEGDYSNYGYLYAKADRLARELNWERDDRVREDESVFTHDPALLELSWPCFDETYTAGRRIAACKALALSCDCSSEEAFLSDVAARAKELGVDFSPSGVRFAPYGPGCPLKIRLQDLEIFRKADFKGDYLILEGYTDEDPFANVEALLKAMTSLDEKTAALRRRMGVAEPPLASVLLTDGPYAVQNSASLSRLRIERGRYEIDSASLATIGQSYASLLFSLRGGGEDPATEDWMIGAMQMYFDFDGFFKLFVMETEREDPTFLPVMEQVLGEPYDSPEDYVRFERLAFGYYDVSIDKKALTNYPELLPVFGYWFSGTYGEEEYLECMLAPSKIPERTGKTLPELFEDFDAWLREPPDDLPAEL